jgi:hypothetical protein
MNCRKIEYPSKEHAEQAFKSIKKRGYLISPNTYIYKCPYGNHYHIGHDKYYKYKNKYE